MANTGLIAEVTNDLNQPLTAWSILHVTSNSPHPPEPVSRPEGAGLEAGAEGVGLADAEPEGAEPEGVGLEGVGLAEPGLGEDADGVGTGAAASDVGV